MPLINTEGLTIIGDGSQWFWSMMAFLAIPITGYAIYSQLRAQRSANRVAAMLALSDEWWSQRLQRHRLDVLMHYAEGKPGSPPGLQAIGNFLERLALLERLGDVDPDVIWEIWGGNLQLWWRRSAAEIAEARKEDPA